MLVLFKIFVMAIIFPPFLKTSIPTSEFQVYRALSHNLSDDWLVIYSPRWTRVNSKGRMYSGEADFLVYNPKHGFLVIEVKGGGIKYCPDKDEWSSENRLGESFVIKNPLDQAKGNLWSIVDLLREQQGVDVLPVPFGHAVLLPSLRSLGDVTHPSFNRHVVGTADELPFIGDWLEEVLGFWRSSTEDVSLDSVQHFEEVLKTTFVPALDLSPQLGADIANERVSFKELSSEQFDLLDGLHAISRVAVRGGAGTGKTILAMKKALNLSLSGVPTLLTCYNKTLAAWMSSRLASMLASTKQSWLLESGMLNISTLHQYALNKLDIEASSLDSWDEIPKLLSLRMNESKEEFVRAIIVDEGQDFGLDWWEAVEKLKVIDDSYLWVFHDPNQAIYQDSDAVSELDNMVPFELTRNYRNTKAIHNELMPLFEGKALTAIGPSGRPPQRVSLAPGEAILSRLEELINQLVSEEGVPPHEIAILTPTRKNSELFVPSIAGIDVQSSGDIVMNKIIVETIFSFKGQERPVVILCEMGKQEHADNRRLRYTALSRASHHVIEIN